jgi:ferredoxin-NADP reductase
VFKASAGFKWQPGQFAKYTLPHNNADARGTERWFTIAAPPYEGSPRITTRIDKENGSSFKRALLALEPGATIEADAPDGEFVISDQNREYVFIAGGIGFTPFHAMLAELGHAGTMPKITILYGARDNQPTYHEELAFLQDTYPQLRIHYVIEPQRIDEALIRQHVGDLKAPVFYISGPEPMVEAFEGMLLGMGVPEANLHMDHFPGYTW